MFVRINSLTMKVNVSDGGVIFKELIKRTTKFIINNLACHVGIAIKATQF